MTEGQPESEETGQAKKKQLPEALKAHQFPKGQSGNPGGASKQITLYKMLKNAIAKVGIEKGKTIFEHIVERAYKSDKVAIALLNTVAPEFKRANVRANNDGKEDPNFQTPGVKIIVIKGNNNVHVNGNGTDRTEPGDSRPVIDAG